MAGYNSPAMLAKARNPAQADFPSLKNAFRRESVLANGKLECLITGTIIGYDDITTPWRTDTGDYFYSSSESPHQSIVLEGGTVSCGSADSMLLVTGHMPSSFPGMPGYNLLCAFHNYTAGNDIMVRSRGEVGTYNLAARSIAANKLAASYYSQTKADRNLAACSVIRQAANIGEYYLADADGIEIHTADDADGVTTGTISPLNSMDYLEINGFGLQPSRLTGIYFFNFANGAPDKNFIQQAMAWMGDRTDGALYPGLMWA